MADDLRNRGPADRARINKNEDWEMDHWSKEFGVTKAKLLEAINAVGVMVVDVRRYLGK